FSDDDPAQPHPRAASLDGRDGSQFSEGRQAVLPTGAHLGLFAGRRLDRTTAESRQDRLWRRRGNGGAISRHADRKTSTRAADVVVRRDLTRRDCTHSEGGGESVPQRRQSLIPALPSHRLPRSILGEPTCTPTRPTNVQPVPRL